MAMDFFEHQDRARKRTGLLLFWFFLAVALTVAALNLGAWLVAGVIGDQAVPLGQWLHLPYWRWITVVALLVMFTGSLVRYISLLEGGEVIAKSVHARRVLPDTADARERVLLNVVEEMAIASGTPVPSVWIMDDEPGINAFVAGFEPTRAVLVITRGGLEAFDREQLQGVIGHEFSHILNGDMRLNVQLYAILAGILLIGKIGEFLMRSVGSSGGNSSSRRGGHPAVLVAGLVLMVVGYAGLFCGRIIKAAISRQREFLADASAVQFTRNPDGIGEALLTIHHAADGSLLHSSMAEDMSHMCIARPVKMAFAGLLATHPPLEQRITAIDPGLLARGRARRHVAARESAAIAAEQERQAAISSFAPPPAAVDRSAPLPFPGGEAATPAVVAMPAIVATVGHPTPAHHDYALRLRHNLPDSLRTLLHRPDGARAVIYGFMLVGSGSALEQAALQRVADDDGADVAGLLQQALPALRTLGSRLYLPCHDLALPTLRALSAAERTKFLATLEQLAQLDTHLSLREYLSLSLMRRHLATGSDARRPVRHRSYRAVAGPLNVVLSLLCHAGGGNVANRADLHARLVRGFGIGGPALLPVTGLDADRLHAALQELADLSPLLKKPLLDACVDAVRHDGRVQVAELELVRAIGEVLDCPVPPLVG